MTQADPIGRFLGWAAHRPGHPAVDAGGVIVTYAELATMARRLALRLSEMRMVRVVIALPQGADAYAAMLGTLLSGAYYIPINVAAAPERLARLADSVQPDAIVTTPAHAEALAAAAPAARIIEATSLASGPRLEGDGQRGPTSYIILTSGSTGEPKGVVIPTAALANYIDWLDASALFGADDRVSQFPSISFDLSVLDIYGALSAGATLVPPAGGTDRMFAGAFVQRSRLSVWVSVPSAIALVVAARQATPAMLGSVRRFIFCGEALRPTHLAPIFAACPDAEVVNLYGPTEATVSMTAVRLHADDYPAHCRESVALGEPIPGMGLHLVGGAHANEGEIVITGPQLATEYWRDPARTAAAFRPVVIAGQTLRGYHTGDWGERHDGQVFFAGRIDQQVKVHGYRIETGEVLAKLANCGWPVACVLKHDDALVAVVEAVAGQTFDPAALRARLFAVLEPHAVPSVVHILPRLPRNSNDKLDERAVRAWLEAMPDAPGGSGTA